ncbi:hypothetical protein TPAR_06712 [Tolypocladium paradoxum]|uniref:Amino acid permease/ SLC12A domain-containing protein n=1 Tax=Tolypocladium paradoxum TaxID=94208 RepID=A0A2S4KSC9_9HYPO|nr:hypothetical protein TPAR_06712 [Tolypocladium paradoxum]
MNVSDASTVVFGYFINLTTILGLLTWISILVSHIFFSRGRKTQGLADNMMPYVAPLGVWGSYVALFVCILVGLTNNYDMFTRRNQEPFGVSKYKTFITGYIGIPIFLGLIFGHKLITKSSRVRSSQLDFFTGKDIIDREEDAFLEDRAARDATAQSRMKTTAAWIYKKGFSWLF